MSKPNHKPQSAKPQKPTIDAMKLFAAEEKAASRQLTLDGFDNFVSRLGLNADNTLSQGEYTFNLVSRNRIKLEAAYRGSWIVGAVVDSIAEDMTRAGVNITTVEGEVDIKDLKREISNLQIWQSLSYLIKWGRLYGGALAVLQIEGQDLSTPLNADTIAQGQFKGLAIYDRWQLNPSMNESIPFGPEMGLPVYYQIVSSQLQNESGADFNSQTVHHSRIIRYTGIDLPFFQAITEMMWGESVLERLWDRLIAFDNATMSSASLIDKANLRTVGIENLREILSAGGAAQEGLLAQFDMMRSLQVNEGITLLDKNDTFASTAYSFAGLSDMLLQFGQQLSGACGIPLVRLFGQSPAGLSATGESDIRMYYDNINAQQEAKLRNGWEKLLKVMWHSVYGFAPPDDLEFTFAPLWQMSAIDKANISKTNAETVTGVFDAGLISKPTALMELRESSGATGVFNNISDDEITESKLELPPAPDANPDEPANEIDNPAIPSGPSDASDLESRPPQEKIKAKDESFSFLKGLFRS